MNVEQDFSLVSGSYAERIGSILEVLKSGPQCPCNMEMKIEGTSRDLFAYFAELLAREWIRVVCTPRDGDASDSIRELKRKLELEKTLQQELSEKKDMSDTDKMSERAKSWYNFFQSVGTDDRDIIYSLAMTHKGRDAYEQIELFA